MSGERIREARPADAEAIGRVHIAAWWESYRGLVPDALLDALSVERNAQMWTAILGAQEPCIVHVVERQRPDQPGATDIVGFAHAGRARSAELGTSGEVTAIYLLEAVKRRGIGRTLLTGVLAALADHGHRSAGLWVLAENHGTRHFYEALGGRIGGKRVVSNPAAPMTEIAYLWDDLSGFGRARVGCSR